MAEKESDYGNYEELPRINKFVGESFGTDNVRTVYAGESRRKLFSKKINLISYYYQRVQFVCPDDLGNVRFKPRALKQKL
jgi:hypothetical protein